MDPRIARVAKEIPALLKRVSNDMFDEATPALRTGVAAARDALRKLEGFLGEVERVHLGAAAAAAAPAAAGRPAKAAKAAKGTRRRRGGNFPIAEFLNARLAENPRGMRPADLAKLVRAAAPGKHKDASAIVHTTLARLRAQKKVVNRDGIWSAAKS